MLEAIHSLTSSSKLKIVDLLAKPRAPGDLAEALGMTRQAADRHLKEMLEYGIVEKMWVTWGKRPRVEFKLSPLGNYFYSGIGEFLSSFRKRGIWDLTERLKSLDIQLISGDIDQERYQELKRELEENMGWFTGRDR